MRRTRLVACDADEWEHDPIPHARTRTKELESWPLD